MCLFAGKREIIFPAKIGCTLGLENTQNYQVQLRTAIRHKHEQIGIWAFEVTELFKHPIESSQFFLMKMLRQRESSIVVVFPINFVLLFS